MKRLQRSTGSSLELNNFDEIEEDASFVEVNFDFKIYLLIWKFAKKVFWRNVRTESYETSRPEHLHNPPDCHSLLHLRSKREERKIIMNRQKLTFFFKVFKNSSLFSV